MPGFHRGAGLKQHHFTGVIQIDTALISAGTSSLDRANWSGPRRLHATSAAKSHSAPRLVQPVARLSSAALSSLAHRCDGLVNGYTIDVEMGNPAHSSTRPKTRRDAEFTQGLG